MASDWQTSEERARECLTGLAVEFYNQFDTREILYMALPTQTESNVEYDGDVNAWVYSDWIPGCSADSVRGTRKLLKAVYTIEFFTRQLDGDHLSTLRKLYYILESWGNGETYFSDQDGSSKLIEDLEIVNGIRHEDFHIRPEGSGVKLMGPLRIRGQTNRDDREIRCQLDVGQGSYQAPNNPGTVEFLEHGTDFVMCVETGGMRNRLVENGLDDDYNVLVVHLDGQPARVTRRITKRLHDELDLSAMIFIDGNPWFYRIFGSVACGSIKPAYLSKYLATPDAKSVDTQPQGIVGYDPPTNPLTDSGINMLQSELEDSQFMGNYQTEQIELQLDIGKKAERQVFASHGLDFVINEYLPTRLDEMGII